MQLGRCDFCLNVSDFKASYDFYAKLGFKIVEGVIEENWSVVEHNNLRIGLYLGDIKEHTINFRGGNVEENYHKLIKKGIKFKKPFKLALNTPVAGTGSATFYDPDSNGIFLDTAESELNILKEVEFDNKNINIGNKSSLGLANIRFKVQDIKKSYDFYKKLNFIKLEGDLNENWIVLGHNNLRLVLFQGKISGFSIGFRGANIKELYNELYQKFLLKDGITEEEDGTLSFILRDPDKNLIYFNS